jgi:SAM-dependent methyltransferase
MSPEKSTAEQEYTERLETLTGKRWKEVLDVQRPYRWNIRRLDLGRTLEVGSGIGRLLLHLPQGSVGVDHNAHSVARANELGAESYSTDDFFSSGRFSPGEFDSVLMAHLLEHLTPEQTREILRDYLPYVRPGGKVAVICPQEKGYATDETHVTFLSPEDIVRVLETAGIKVVRSYSFPFPRPVGKVFAYNETVVLGTTP